MVPFIRLCSDFRIHLACAPSTVPLYSVFHIHLDYRPSVGRLYSVFRVHLDYGLLIGQLFDKSHLIALDEGGRTLAIGHLRPGQPEPATAAVYRFDAILGAELVENALTLSKVSKTSRITTSPPRTRQSTGMAPASAEAVPVTASTEEVRELTLKIYLSSEETPVVSIPFLPRVQPTRKTDLHYSAALMEAHLMHERIRNIVSA